jgi:hypothetical protein
MLIVALAAFCGTASANVLLNPSMEIDADPIDGDPDGWWDWGSNYTAAADSSVQEFVEDAAQARTGSWYGHCWSDPAGYTNILPPWSPVEEGKTYYAGIWVKDIRPGGSLTDVGIEFLYATGADGSGRDDTYKHVISASVPNNGQYNLISAQASIPVPAGFGYMVIGFNGLGGSEYNVDDFYLDTRPPGGAPGVHSPQPADNSKTVPGCIDLRWTRFKGLQGDDLTCTLYWNGGSADVNDNNFEPSSPYVTKLMDDQDANSYSCVTVAAEEDHYWRVDCEDPNGGNGGVETLIGPVWYFTTVNDPPEVDAGIKQAKWQASGGGSVTFQLDPTVSDDGLPVPPGGLTYSWTKTAGSGAVTFSPSSTVEDPCAIISDPCAVDDYVLQLSVNDGSGAVTDTVKLRVHANGTTGLEARYDMEEGDAAAGIHDDYSGYERNPGGGDGLGPPSRRGERMVRVGTAGSSGAWGTTMDTTGGHNAQPEQLPSDTTKGGIVFDGGDGYVQASNSLGDPNEDAPGGAVRTWADFENEVSVGAWIKIEEGNLDKPWQSIICNGDTSYRLQQSGGSGNLQFSCNITADDDSTSTASAATSDIDFDDGQWHHIMGTYDGTEIAIYADGLLEAANATEGTIDIGNDWLTYGHNLGYLATDNPESDLDGDGIKDGDGIRDGDDTVQDTTFNGVMDEIRIHSIGLPWRSDDPGNPEAGTPDMTTARSVVSIYRASDGHENCGGNYLPGDIDENCYVELADVKLMAQEWLDCSSIDRERCDGFWR